MWEGSLWASPVLEKGINYLSVVVSAEYLQKRLGKKEKKDSRFERNPVFSENLSSKTNPCLCEAIF